MNEDEDTKWGNGVGEQVHETNEWGKDVTNYEDGNDARSK